MPYLGIILLQQLFVLIKHTDFFFTSTDLSIVRIGFVLRQEFETFFYRTQKHLTTREQYELNNCETVQVTNKL